MIIDTHAHLDLFGKDVDDIVKRARKKEVMLIVTIIDATHPVEGHLRIAESYTEVRVGAGVHPHNASKWNSKVRSRIARLMMHEKAVLVGEIGLDFFRMHSPKEVQRKVFCEQIELAIQMKKPISVHIRDAYPEALKILRGYPEVRGKCILHCYSSDWETAIDFIEFGCYLSFAGPLTYPNAQKLRETAKNVHLKNILVETDCPYLPPQRFRGKRNEPAYVRYILEEIARLKKMEFEALVRQIFQNCQNIFGIKHLGSDPKKSVFW